MATDPLSTANGQDLTNIWETFRQVYGTDLPNLADSFEALAQHPLGG